MSKKTIDERIDATLDQITDHEWQASLFAGFNTAAVRDILIDDLDNHWPASAQHELGEVLSLGGVRIIKMDATTKERHLKRLALLFHRVPGYHSQAETEQLRNTILKQSRADVLPRAKHEVQRALRFMQDEELWGKEVAVRHAGSLTHYYNQGRDNRLNDFDKTENGWCLGMSVHWLACRAQKMEFWDSHLSEMGASKYRFIMAAQGVRTAGAGTTSDRASFRLKKYGLNMETTTWEYADTAGERMPGMITGSGSTFVRIGQYYVGGGGHAMAACLEGGGVRFLDPNLGEFLFKTVSGFESWYPLFLRKMDYRFTKYYIEGYALKTTSPAPTTELKDALAGRRAAMGYDD